MTAQPVREWGLRLGVAAPLWPFYRISCELQILTDRTYPLTPR